MTARFRLMHALLAAWGIYRRPRSEGPTGISPVVLDAATQRGMHPLGVIGPAPHYLQRTENPAVIQALLTYVTRLLDLDLDMSQFDEAIQDFRTQCDQAVARDSSTQAHVRQLEQDYDATVGEERQTLRDEELNPEKLMQELEDFLREEREGGNMG